VSIGIIAVGALQKFNPNCKSTELEELESHMMDEPGARG
jgi:hypothetical protein